MVYVLLDGRLGNNLFQIAAAASFANENNDDFQVVVRDYYTPDSQWLIQYLKQFENNILRKIVIKHNLPENVIEYREEKPVYAPIPYAENILLIGFFQSDKYFNPEVVRSLFEIDEATAHYIELKYGHLFRDEITSIHVRRGDYLISCDQFSLCSYKYFQDAIAHIGSDKRYLITSDDIAWCRKKFKGKNFFFSEGEKAIVDIYLQSLCTNNVISNSSFSWWGAWLNINPNKKVICPTPWFALSFKDKNKNDLIPDGWTELKNKTPWLYTITGYYIWYKKRLDYKIQQLKAEKSNS